MILSDLENNKMLETSLKGCAIGCWTNVMQIWYHAPVIVSE